eukprot:jgi/Chrzof1/11907/Cz06g14070.t1
MAFSRRILTAIPTTNNSQLRLLASACSSVASQAAEDLRTSSSVKCLTQPLYQSSLRPPLHVHHGANGRGIFTHKAIPAGRNILQVALANTLLVVQVGP